MPVSSSPVLSACSESPLRALARANAWSRHEPRAPRLDRDAAAAHPRFACSHMAESFVPRTPRPLPECDEPHRAWLCAEVLPHEPALRAWLRSQFPTVADVDDVVQECYVRLLRSRAHGTIANPRSYLFSLARNLVLDQFRRRRASPVVAVPDTDQCEVPSATPTADEAASRAQEIELVLQAIDALPERCREIMMMRKCQELPNAEIARRLGLSVNTVNAQIVLGLARCRTFLLARGVNLGGRR